jgi:hypothetical protein
LAIAAGSPITAIANPPAKTVLAANFFRLGALVQAE